MGVIVTSDTTGETLPAGEATNFNVTITLRVGPHETISLERHVPPIIIRKTSENVKDNPEWQALAAEVSAMLPAMNNAWNNMIARLNTHLITPLP